MKKTHRLALRQPRPARLLLCALFVAGALAACRVPAPTGTPGAYPISLTATPPAPTTAPGYPVGTSVSGATPPPVLTPNLTAAPQSTYTLNLPYVSAPMGSPTPPPTATAPPPPPTPVWPDPIAGQTASKLGLHVIRNEDYAYAMEYVRRVHPRVMKAMDDVGWLADVKAASPSTVTIGRFNGQAEHWVGTTDPVAAADAYVATNLERYRANPGVDYWEGWNEYNPSSNEDWEWYAKFEAERACVMQANGLRAAVGDFAVGWPNTYEQMGLFLPALEAAHRCGGILTLHEYNSPTFQCGVGVNASGAIPGAPSVGDVVVGYNTLRYRIWYDGYLKPRGLGDLPLVISELGIQGLARGGPCNDPGGVGWKDYGDWWVKQGYGPDPERAYVNLLAWYDDEMRKDPYVIGATIFTLGALNGSDQWHSFDLHDVLPLLAFYAAGQQ